MRAARRRAAATSAVESEVACQVNGASITDKGERTAEQLGIAPKAGSDGARPWHSLRGAELVCARRLATLAVAEQAAPKQPSPTKQLSPLASSTQMRVADPIGGEGCQRWGGRYSRYAPGAQNLRLARTTPHGLPAAAPLPAFEALSFRSDGEDEARATAGGWAED